jgi:plasmid stabilization system protein ParE
MRFKIDVHPQAVSELEGIHAYLSEFSSDAADRTFLLLKHGIVSLSDFPRRCPQAPESVGASVEIRHLVVGNYRILFSIIGQTVHIWRVRHGAQDHLDPGEIF